MAGSAEDPVVTKSYVDEQIRRYLGDLENQRNRDNSAPAPTNQGNNPNSDASSKGQNAAAADVTIIQLEAGQRLFGGAGAEFVVRTGQAVAFSTDENGIIDATAGKDLSDGTPIETNHLLLFPRDGRGIKPDPAKASVIYVMVKGNYLLVNSDGSKTTP
jgi:hypothetical protein